MPLVASTLTNALKALFSQEPFPADTTAAGAKWADAYHSYGSAALAGATTPVPPVLLGKKTALASALKGAFDAAGSAGMGGLAVVVGQLDTAFVAFWTGVAFAAPGIAGVVSVVPPGVLSGTLTAAFNAGASASATADSQASLIATALDAWTHTVTVINTPVSPPGPPLPPVPLA